MCASRRIVEAMGRRRCRLTECPPTEASWWRGQSSIWAVPFRCDSSRAAAWPGASRANDRPSRQARQQSAAARGCGTTALDSPGTSCRSSSGRPRTRRLARPRRYAPAIPARELGAPDRSVESCGEVDVVHHSAGFEVRFPPGDQRSPTARSAFVPCRYTPASYTSNGTGSRKALMRPS